MVLQSIRLHPASFSKIYPDRQINNIYFDTPHLTTYRENVIGASERKKFRVRWYGFDPHLIEQPNLEIKMRHNQLGSKKVMPVEAFSLTMLDPITKTVQQKCHTHGLRPVLMNSYNRSYFGTTDKKYRITVDTNLRYFSLLAANNFTQYNIKDAGIVLEIKYDEHIDDSTDRIINYLPYRQTKSSKYVTGVQLSNI